MGYLVLHGSNIVQAYSPSFTVAVFRTVSPKALYQCRFPGFWGSNFSLLGSQDLYQESRIDFDILDIAFRLTDGVIYWLTSIVFCLACCIMNTLFSSNDC